jgi:hypothetical protein
MVKFVRYHWRMQRMRGMSFMDVIIGSAMALLIFVALFGLLRASLLVSSLAKAKSGATAVANNQMEYVRSLSYDAIGTSGGIPAGSIPQNATSTLNGIAYKVRTLVEYYDDPADGSGSGDANGITTDYKRVKVAVTYSVRNASHEVDLVSNFAPVSIETTTNGGTLRVAVVNASGAAVPGASVRVQNASASPSIDFTTYADATGYVSLPGAPVSSQYQIAVSKTGYSSAQTYARDTTNQNPTPGYLTVSKNLTTTGTFAIDLLSSLTLRTLSPIAAASSTDLLNDAAGLASQSGTQVAAGALALAQTGGVYGASGTAIDGQTAPNYLASWTSASASVSIPVGTTLRVHVLDGAGAPLPDSVLPGNATGFSSFPVNLSGISTTTYPSLALSADLGTSNGAATPQVLDWTIAYTAGPTPVSGVGFTLTGAKTIGTTGAGAAIYKTIVSGTTNAGGTSAQSLEWDAYKLAITGFDPVDACSPPPYTLAPGASADQSIYVTTATTNSLLVTVTDDGVPVSGATVTLSKSGFTTRTATTSSCGGAYFGGLASAATYKVVISKSGYTTTTYTNVSVSGHPIYATAFP